MQVCKASMYQSLQKNEKRNCESTLIAYVSTLPIVSLQLHCCILSVSTYFTALYRYETVGDVSKPLMRSTSSIRHRRHHFLSSLSLTHCHLVFCEYFSHLFVFLSISPLLHKFLSLLKVLLLTPNSFSPQVLS